MINNIVKLYILDRNRSICFSDNVQIKTSPEKDQFSPKFRRSTKIRRDSMKEMLCKSMVEKVTDFMNVVSTIPPSRIDGFISGLNMLMSGKVACYQVILHTK